MRSRPLVVAAVLAVATGLSGCTLVGDVHVGRESITVDLLLDHGPNIGGPCEDTQTLGVSGLTVSRRDAPPPRFACSITGTAEMSTAESLLDYFLVTSGDHTFFRVPPMSYFTPSGAEESTLDLTLHFDGPVVAASSGARIEGSRVRWTDVEAMKRDGLAATARTGGLAPWLLPAALGLLAGGTVGVAGALWWGRRPPTPGTTDVAPGQADAPVCGFGAAGASPEPGFPRPESTHTPASGGRPGGQDDPLTSGDVDQPPEDPSVWSRPD